MRRCGSSGRRGTKAHRSTNLTEAMGINRSSLYSSFGDKESLFRRAIARYRRRPHGVFLEALKLPSARAVVEALLRGTVEFLVDPTHPRGCLSLQGGMACGGGGEA